MTDTTVTTETPPQPAPDPAPAPAPSVAPPRPAPQFVQALGELRQAKRDLEAENARLRREGEERQALYERAIRQVQGEQPQQTIQQPTPPTSPLPDINTAVAQEMFRRDVAIVNQAGLKEFGTVFNESVNVLDSLVGREQLYGMVSEMMAVDQSHTHKIIDALARDTDKAVMLSQMTPAQRMAELTRMSITMKDDKPAAAAEPAPTPAKKISSAPAPAPSIAPAAHKEVDWRNPGDEDTAENNAVFSKGWDAHMAERMKRR
jgi:hypothetical protein